MRKKTTEDLVGERPTSQELKNLERYPIDVILDNVRSLENVGLVFRLTDALRFRKLYLTGITGYPPMGKSDPRPSNIQEHAQNQITKTAIKIVEHVPWEYRADVLDLVEELKMKGSQIVSLEQTDYSRSYQEAEFHFPLALILGHEREGVTDKLLQASDLHIEIPMHGIGNSLNLATALAVVGYELIRKLPEK